MKDLTAWQIKDGFVVPKPDGTSPTSGMHSVLQRVLCILLNEHGSQRYSFGRKYKHTCGFMNAWQAGQISDESKLRAQFALARTNIKTVFDEQKRPDDPPTQRFKDIALQRIIIQPGTVQLEIVLETEAARETFLLPLPT